MAADDKVGMRLLSSTLSPSMQSMQPMQQYQYDSNGQHADYRAAPPQQHTAMSHPTLLPPIQHFDGQNMQSQPPFHPASMNGAQMSPHPPPPPPYHPNQFQYPNGAMQPAPMPSSVGANGQNGMMRFPIPPQGPMPMTGGRGKNKEVKRRTKTGCLTCRKRRIKCDEGHPTCRNCQKSKRECLGYDPIFKPQPGPAPIQPAPANSSTPTSKSTPSSATLPPNTYPHSQSYPGTGGTFVPANNPAQGADSPFEYGAPLDPALAGGDGPLTMAANSYSTTLQPSRRVKPIAMEQLFSLNDVPPRYEAREAPLPNSMPPQREIDDFYSFHYAPGLDKLFETKWYTTLGLTQLQRNPSLIDFVAQCMDQMRSRTDDMASIRAVQSLEARLVWQLAIMPRSASWPNGANGVNSDHQTLDLLPRIDTVEHLLTGQFLPPARMPPPPSSDHQHDGVNYDRMNFWCQLGHYTCIRDDTTDAAGLREIKVTLDTMRGILGMLENRDVLYSIAIARHIGGRSPEFRPPQPVVSQTNDPEDDMRKLQVAQQFIEGEDQKGTTQVIQRICSLAIRSWILQKR